MTDSLKPGLCQISAAAYFALPAINASTLKPMRRSPAHARYAMEHPADPTGPQDLGQATHCAILEPERFEEDYGRAKYQQKVLKAERAWWKEAEQDPDRIWLRPKDYDAACAMRDRAWANGDARALLDVRQRRVEVSAVWHDEDYRLWGKCRVDLLTMHEGWSVVADLKTCRDAREWRFSKDIDEYGYHLSAGWYLRGLNILAPRPRLYRFICVENQPPHEVKVWQLDDRDIAQGEQEILELAVQYRDCEDTGVWPGYAPGVENIRLPKYRRADDDEEIAA